jgi:hypothetical protein
MSVLNTMPLHGALLISNPRREKKTMALALTNPNYYRRLNRQTRSDESQQRAAARKQLRAQFRSQYGVKWSENDDARGEYEAEASRQGISAKDLVRHVTSGSAEATSSDVRNARGKARRALAKQLGFTTYTKGSKALAYRFPKKRMTITTKTGKKRIVVDAAAVQQLNASRSARRMASDAFDAAARRWAEGYTGPKAAGLLLAAMKAGTHSPQLPAHEYAVPRSERRRQAKKAATTRKRAGILPFGGKAARYPKGQVPPPWAKWHAFRRAHPGLSSTEASALYQRQKGSFYEPQETATWDNPRYFGALALENPLPFVGGVAGSVVPKLLSGIGGAAVHALLPMASKIPVVGEYAETGLDKLHSVAVPSVVPVIGGMGLGNTIVGALGGLGLIALTQFAGRKLGVPAIEKYGAIAGAGAIMAGPVMDYFNVGENADVDEDLSGLALENLGGLALENLGDGMAYQLAGVMDEEYGQASLADAYYSGVDFGVVEGQSLVAGRGVWHGRFGQAPRRWNNPTAHGPSHLAGRQGHKWGWLIKMVGWENTQKIAAMPPRIRLQTLKKLREAAIAAFQQLQSTAATTAETPVQVSGDAVEGAVGAMGAESSFGSTIFAGPGM